PGQHWDVALLKMTNGIPSVVDLHNYAAHYYSTPPDANHVTPFFTNIDDAVVYASGSHYYLIIEAGGLGDVYEIDGTAGSFSNPRAAHPDGVMTTPTMSVNASTSPSFTIPKPHATLDLTGVAITDPLLARFAVSNRNGPIC